MKFQIVGADRETGEDVEIIVDARDEVDAEAIAGRRNIMVSHVAPVRLAPQAQVIRQAPPPQLELGHVPGAPSVNVHLPRRSSSLGIASLVLGIVAFLFCWIPLLGIVSTPLSALGLVLAIAGFLVALFRRGTGIGYPIAGGLTSGLALFIAISMTMATSEAIRHVANVTSEDRATNQEVIRPSGRAPTGGAAAAGPKQSPGAARTEVSWAPGTERVRQGDVQVRVVSVRVGRIILEDTIRADTFESSQPYLRVVLEVKNASQSRKLDFTTWMGGDFSISRDFASVRDNHDNIYKRIDFGFSTHAQGHVESDSLYPGKSLYDVLVFEPPISDIDYLRLELPAKNFGGEGMIRFEIPKTMIER